MWRSFRVECARDGVISRARFRRRFPDAIPTRPDEFESWWRQRDDTLRVLDARLSQHPYLVDDTFTTADITLYAYEHCAEERDFELGFGGGWSGLKRTRRICPSTPCRLAQKLGQSGFGTILTRMSVTFLERCDRDDHPRSK